MNYAEAEIEISDLLINPFWPTGQNMWRTGYYMPMLPRRATPRPWVPAGAQAAWLRAAALRTLTQGEG